MLLMPGVGGLQLYYNKIITSGAISFIQPNVGIHAKTQRDTYIVPDRRRIKLDMLSVEMIRTAASSAEAQVSVTIEINPAANGEYCIHCATLYGKLKGDVSHHEHDSNLFLVAGDEISIYTTDPSLSGTVSYLVEFAYQIFEY